jgi:predicted RNase H-like nuclease (RuvC/YqgF family)
MDIQTFLLFGVPAVVIVLTWLGFKVEGPHLFAHLWARIQASRKEREELRKQVEELRKQVEGLRRKQGDSQTTYSEWVRGSVDRLNNGLISLTRAIEEQQHMVDDLHQRITSLESRTITSMPAKQTGRRGGPLSLEEHQKAAESLQEFSERLSLPFDSKDGRNDE